MRNYTSCNYLKTLFILLLFCSITLKSYGQVSIGHVLPHPSAEFDIASTAKGVLLTRMTQNQRNAINNPANSLLIYCLDCQQGAGYYVYDTLSNPDVWLKLSHPLSTDGTLALNSDTLVPSQKAVKAFVEGKGYLTSQSDDQIISRNGLTVTLENGGSFQDSVLTETQVDAMVSNNGYLSSFTEVDGSITNEIQNISRNGLTVTLENGGSFQDSVLTETQVDAMVSNNGYLSSFTEVDGSTTNEIQNLNLSENNLQIDGGTGADLSSFMDNTDNQSINRNGLTVTLENGGSFQDSVLTEIQVDAMVSDNGYLTSFTEQDASITNEIQTINRVGDTIKLSNGGYILDTADNLGNHTATANIQLNNKYLSNDGDDEGIAIDSDGKVGIGVNTMLSRLQIAGTDTVTPGILLLNSPLVGKSHTQFIAGANIDDRPLRIMTAHTSPGFTGGLITFNMNFQNNQYTQGAWGGSSSIEFFSGDIVFKGDTSHQGGSTTVIDPKYNLVIKERGNVGVGMFNPLAKLHVDGDFRLQNGVAVNEISNDSLLSAGSATVIPTQKAVKDYVTTHGGLITDGKGNYQGSRSENFVNLESTASHNLALGGFALALLKTGNSNIGIGSNAGKEIRTGSNNVAIGNIALMLDTSGSSNIAIGSAALHQNRSGALNTAIGTSALNSNKVGHFNVAIGPSAGKFLNTHFNTIVGANSGFYATGSSNVYLGYDAGYYDTAGVGSLNGNLFIENSKSLTPLIGGDFNTDKVGINISIDSLNRVGRATLQVGGDISLLNGVAVNEISNDGTLADNSDLAVPTEKAIKTFVEGKGYLIAEMDGSTTNEIQTISRSGLLVTLSNGGNTFMDSVDNLGNHIASKNLDLSSFKLVGDGGSAGLTIANDGKLSLAAGVAINEFSNDQTLSGNSDIVVPTEKAVKTYIDLNKGLPYSAILSKKNVHGNNNNMIQTQASASSNTALGHSALESLTTGNWNTALGHEAGKSLTSGNNNLFIGEASGQNINTQSGNVAVGVYSLRNAQGRENIAIGYRSGYQSEGDDNVSIGYQAGYQSKGDNNIYIGYNAGYYDNTIGTERLYFENSKSNTPLIGGDFTQNKVGINMHIDSLNKVNKATLQIGGDLSLLNGLAINEFSGDVNMTDSSVTAVPTEAAVKAYVQSNGLGNHTATKDLNLGSHRLLGGIGGSFQFNGRIMELKTNNGSGQFTVDNYGNVGIGVSSFAGRGVSNTLHLANNPASPGGGISDGVLLFAQDVSSSSELKVVDEAGNTTTLSPHNFSLSPKSDPMAWSFYSENSKLEQRINIDMLKAINLIEQMSGEKLVYRENMKTGARIEEKKQAGEIEVLRSSIEELKDLVKQQNKEIEQLKNKSNCDCNP